MITCEFTTGKKSSYYEVTVGISETQFSFGIYTKASFDAVASALRACIKDSYLLTIVPTKVFHSEYESLDTACALLSRLRFVEYTTKEVEKTIIVTETVKREL